ncbi:MAG: radical SAM protein [candidate division KSB1 bacterium]|nr:radical SAM protein [candidate division KSB1 bacterium]MDZ7345958.1 radical SAM protein [candidate division KSB1 bacterium]
MNKGFWNIGIAKEVAVRQVLRALTLRRIWNAAVNSASFALSALLRRPIVWGMPVIINIEPTNLCNLRCPLCTTGSGQMQRPRGKLNFELYRRLIDELAPRAIYVTLYHQGEPYLHPLFNRMVAYAKSKGLYVTTSSNGHYFTAETAEDVVRSGLDSMIISLDGVSQESYARYRVGGDLSKVLDGIRCLTAAKKRLHSRTPYLFVQFLVMRHNESEIPAMKQLATELGVDRLLIKTTQVGNAKEAVEWLPEDEEYRRYRLDDGRLEVKRGKGVCPRPWLTTLMDWDGVVVPCCFDKNAEHPFGNLNAVASFRELWHNQAYRNFRRQILRSRPAIDICRTCNYGIGLFK